MVVPPHTGGATTSTAPGSRASSVAGASAAPTKAKMYTPTAPGTLNGPPSGNNHAIPLSARRAEPLDLATVERRGQPNMPSEKVKAQRVLGILNAPVYTPTEEEFRDPMEYMRKIAPEGSKFGIVKVIPPDSWNPPFAINTERFHFRTRRQELNSVEGGNRVNNDYLDQLAKFHKQNGHNLNRFPSVDKRPLDLYRLKKTVERKGGFDQVCKGKRWAEVGRDLGYSGKIMSSLSTSLKNSYQKWLLPYEEYLRLAKPGVQHQIEMMNGGPYTPSPGPSPTKMSHAGAPQRAEHASTMQASAALNASINGQAAHMTPKQDTPRQTPAPPPQAASGGFTPVNAGGFTPVNVPQPAPSFTAVNGANGFHSSNSTPQRPVGTPPTNSGPHPVAPHPNGIGALKRQHSELTAEEVDMMNRRSKRLRKDIPTVAGSNMHHSRMPPARYQSMRDRADFKPGEMCESCGKPDEPHKRLRCESCDCAYHMYCLEPQVKQRPDYEWHCPRCLVGTNEYGFEEGDVYSLAGFQKKATNFKTNHFSNIPRQYNPLRDDKTVPDEDDVEREFWRLVEDLSDTTEVEYGADIHSTTHGSGFPTIEKHPRDPYSTDPWNLNILPLDKESLFRHIKSDISGMTVPWLYVGMVFSTFCWHNEDHFTYSANYQHFGDTKTWYGIPADDTERFEQAMRDEVPELFETQPDLLFQLVTLAKPDKLRKAGVRVYAIDQHAGQFVITFPQAYHAGFNHGFNFNEAVNFAPHDWEPYGEAGVKRLRDYRKQPCFSHDELLMTAASRDHTIRTAKWLAPALIRMRDDELASRAQFLNGPDPDSGTALADPYHGPRYGSSPELIDPETEEDEVICVFCKAYCYLSRYVCKKTGKYLCLLHAGSYECCDALEHERYSGQNGEHVLFYRMNDDPLCTAVRKVDDKAHIPETWAAKVDHELDGTPRPSLKHLRTLLAEGEKIQFELPQLPDLKRFVEKCNEWVEEATNYITRKQTGRRKSEKAGRKGSAKVAELEEREKELRNVANIQSLLASADHLGFDCAEITTLRERAERISQFQRDANVALNNIRDKTTDDFEELVERGKEFHVDIPEIDNLDRVLRRLRWNDLAKQKRPHSETNKQDQTLVEIEDFIQLGVEVGVTETNSDMIFFREHVAQGEVWEQKAKELMAVEVPHYQQLNSLAQQADSLPVNKDTRSAVEAILKKQREISDKINSIVERSRNLDFRTRPTYREVKDVMDSLEELQSKPSGTIDLEKEMRRHEDWMRRGKKLFGKANAPLHILHQHMMLVDKRNEACFDLTDKPRGPVEPSSRAPTPDESITVTDGSGSSRDVFCICRRTEAGMMIECELCHEWYHGKCLKIARGKVKEDDKYTCPICDWRVKIPRDAARPRLEDLQVWLDEIDMLPFQPEEEKTLTNICDYGQSFRDYIKPHVEPAMPPTADEVGTLRFYLRKIEGADILLADETNYLRRELHKFAPVAPKEPPTIEVSNSTRKPRPTKQQKLMAQLGITNPEDLPQQFKMKPHVAKRKASEAVKNNQPLQPAGPSASPSGPQTPGTLASQYGYSTLHPDAKKHLTALCLQVLGPLAGAPIVDSFMAGDPHANREKLMKVKAVLLENDPDVVGDLEKFKAAVNAQPTPAAHAPYAYDLPPDLSTGPPAYMYPGGHIPSQPGSGSPQPPRLGSPARFSPQQYSPHRTSSSGYGGGSGGGGSIFDPTPHVRFGTPPLHLGGGNSNDGKSTSSGGGGGCGGGGPGGALINTSGIPSGMPSGMFESPHHHHHHHHHYVGGGHHPPPPPPHHHSHHSHHHHSHSGSSSAPTANMHVGGGYGSHPGLHSPGYGGRPESAGGGTVSMDSVFADLVHDDQDGPEDLHDHHLRDDGSRGEVE